MVLGMLLCMSFPMSLCIFIVSNALLMSSVGFLILVEACGNGIVYGVYSGGARISPTGGLVFFIIAHPTQDL